MISPKTRDDLWSFFKAYVVIAALFLAIAFLCSSCSTVKKVFNKEKSTIDSVQVKKVDSVGVSKKDTTTTIIKKDSSGTTITVEIDTEPGDTVRPEIEIKPTPPVTGTTKGGKKITLPKGTKKVTIEDADEETETTAVTGSRTDSAAVSRSDSAHKKQDKKVVSESKKKTSMAFGMWILIIAGLIIIAIWAYRKYKSFFIV